MGLKAKVCFAGDMGLGFGWDLGLGFDSLLEIDYGGRTQRTWKGSFGKIMKGIKKKKKTRKTFINLFCFDVFGYKESIRKTKKMIRK